MTPTMKRVRITKQERDKRICERYDRLRTNGYTHNKAVKLISEIDYIGLSISGINGILYGSGRTAIRSKNEQMKEQLDAEYWKTACRELIRQLTINNRDLPQCMASVSQMGILLHFKKKLEETT